MKPSELLRNRKRWCKHHLATDAHGLPVTPEAKNARHWCLMGAIHRCFANLRARERAIAVITKHTGSWVGAWNDEEHRTHADVLAVLRKAGL